ncbi:MAG: Gfo/Idh/MocA family protein [Promethearchaeota archaeon]
MIGIGIIGTGYWGKNHVRIYKSLLLENKINYLKICDIDENRARQIAEDYGLDYLIDINDMIKDDKLTAVVIVTPADNHFEIAKLMLNNGKDVFIEKPMTLNSDKAMELVEIAKKKNLIMMVGHIFRFHPIVQDLKKRIDLGEFGSINLLYTFRFALGVPRADIGVDFDLAAHDIDVSCFFLKRDYPKSLMADCVSFHQDKVIEMANISLEFPNKARSYLMETWNVPVYDKKRELVVIGTEKSAIADYLNPNEYRIFDTKIKKRFSNGKEILEIDEKTVIKIVLEYKEPLREEILHFVNCLKNRKNPLSDGMVGYRTIKMCEAVTQSAKENKKIFF